jgi:hypothetical protein
MYKHWRIEGLLITLASVKKPTSNLGVFRRRSFDTQPEKHGNPNFAKKWLMFEKGCTRCLML